MKRTDFIKNIIGLFGIGVLPKTIMESYQKCYLLQCFVRGFQFYNGPKILHTLQQGQLVELFREPENIHDACAIAIYCNQHKIGYVPAEQNEILSRLMDSDVVKLAAELTHIEPHAATWENVHIAIYILKAIDQLPAHASYLSVVETPEYYTLKDGTDRIYRLTKKGDEILDGDDFYEALVDNSKTDRVYDLIHNDIGSAEAMEAIVDESLLIINRKRIPADLLGDEILNAIEEGMIELDEAFNEEGYVCANINRVAKMVDRIEHFKPVKDKNGNVFWEVEMGK